MPKMVVSMSLDPSVVKALDDSGNRSRAVEDLVRQSPLMGLKTANGPIVSIQGKQEVVRKKLLPLHDDLLAGRIGQADWQSIVRQTIQKTGLNVAEVYAAIGVEYKKPRVRL